MLTNEEEKRFSKLKGKFVDPIRSEPEDARKASVFQQPFSFANSWEVLFQKEVLFLFISILILLIKPMFKI